MSIQAVALDKIPPLLLALYEKICIGRAGRRADFDNALEKLIIACDETLAYIKMANQNGIPIIDREASLTRLWRTAAMAFRRVDPGIADTCFLKGDYWLDPSKWSEQQIKDREIGIELVARKARGLFLSDS